jgi:hypothetical protein
MVSCSKEQYENSFDLSDNFLHDIWGMKTTDRETKMVIKENWDLVIKIQSLEKENKNFQKTIDDLEKDKEQVTNKNLNLQNIIKNFEKEKERMKQKIDVLSTETKEIKDKNLNLKHTVKDFEKYEKQMIQENQNLKKKIAKIEAQHITEIKKKESENECLNKRIKKLEEIIQTLKEENSKNDSEWAEKYNEKLEESNKIFEDTQQKLHDRENEILILNKIKQKETQEFQEELQITLPKTECDERNLSTDSTQVNKNQTINRTEFLEIQILEDVDSIKLLQTENSINLGTKPEITKKKNKANNKNKNSIENHINTIEVQEQKKFDKDKQKEEEVKKLNKALHANKTKKSEDKKGEYSAIDVKTDE